MTFDETRTSPDRSGAASATAASEQAATARCTWLSAAINTVLTGLQIGIGILASSQALVADGVHSLSDLVSDALVLFVNRHSRKGADADHPYGHQRFETAATLALGVLLLGVAGGMLAAAVMRLDADAPIPTVHPMALAIAGFTLVAKELLFRYLMAVGKRLRSTLLVANAWHARSDAASSLVVGLGIAGNLAGYPLLDPVAAVIVGFLVGRMGWTFAWNALHDLVDGSADALEVEAIRETLAATPGVAGVHDVRTRKMGDQIVVDVHLEIDGTLTVEAGHAIAADAHARVLARHRVLHVMTHVDPWHPPGATAPGASVEHASAR